MTSIRGILARVGLCLCACAPARSDAGPPRPPPVAPDPAPPPAQAASPASDPEPVAPPATPVCKVELAPRAPVARAAAACVPVPVAVQRRVRARMVERHVPTHVGAQLRVTFACDPVGRPVELVHESGSGHGQDLTLVRLRLRGRQVEALRVTRPSYFDSSAAFSVERAELAVSVSARQLADLRGLLLARLDERIPDDAADGRFSMSSHDWHGLLRITDAAGHALERRFTGYDSSEVQLGSVPMAEVSQILGPVLEQASWRPAAVDADAQSFFAARAVVERSEDGEWWVRERLVLLSEYLGSPALVVRLVALAQQNSADASAVRSRGYAVAALAAITGYDARLDEKGAARTIAEAASVYARICRPAPE